MGFSALITLLTEALKAWTAWTQIRILDNRYVLQRKIESDIESSEKDIADLRRAGDAQSALRADLMFQRILRSQGVLAAIPAASAPASGGSPGPDASGSIHPPS